MKPIRSCLLLVFSALASLSAAAQPAEITGPDLRPQRVTLLSIDDQNATYIDQRGTQQQTPIDQVLRLKILTSSKPAGANSLGTAWLTDGQVLRGRWDGVVDEETLRWSTLGGTIVELSLDDVLAVSLAGATARKPAKVEGDDALGLVNGERLLGFVESLSAQGIDFVVGDAKDPIPIPLDRVSWFTVDNDLEPTKLGTGLARVVLADGSRLRVSQMRVQRDPTSGQAMLQAKLNLAAEDQGLELEMSQVSRIEPIGGTLTLEPLSELAYEVVAGGTVFGLPMPPRADEQGTLHLHAPLTLRYKLPAGTTRLSAVAGLDLGPEVPAQRMGLVGFELVIRQGDSEIFRQAIDEETPELEINLPVLPGILEIELDPGVNGPVLDRLVLRNAELLVGQP